MGKSALGIVRSTVLIGPDGRVRHWWESASAKGHAAQVLDVLRGLAGKS
jgi:peroxiredoxin Q/BCP